MLSNTYLVRLSAGYWYTKRFGTACSSMCLDAPSMWVLRPADMGEPKVDHGVYQIRLTLERRAVHLPKLYGFYLTAIP
jgi:hypothetical protein